MVAVVTHRVTVERVQVHLRQKTTPFSPAQRAHFGTDISMAHPSRWATTR
jgi:hypothetical protein